MSERLPSAHAQRAARTCSTGMPGCSSLISASVVTSVEGMDNYLSGSVLANAQIRGTSIAVDIGVIPYIKQVH